MWLYLAIFAIIALCVFGALGGIVWMAIPVLLLVGAVVAFYVFSVRRGPGPQGQVEGVPNTPTGQPPASTA